MPRLRRTAHRPETLPLHRTRAIPSQARSIAEAVIIKDEDLFLVSERDGSVPLGGQHGFGLYYHDCRYLNGYDLCLAGESPDQLVASAGRGSSAIFELTNSELHIAPRKVLPAQTIGIKSERVMDGRNAVLEERLTFTNFSLEAIEIPLRFRFQSAFEDIFTVRGLVGATAGRMRRPWWDAGALCFLYEGRDGVHRSLVVHFTPRPQRMRGVTAEFRLRLQPDQPEELRLAFVVSESDKLREVQRRAHAHPELHALRSSQLRRADRWVERHTSIHTSSVTLNRAIERSLLDLHMLRNTLDGRQYFAAGTPWFATLFGRDSLITAMETLAFDPSISEQTLRLLAELQGTRRDEWRDEEPGKIAHELRVGELARLGRIPHTPYYGTVDATPLFLMLLAEHACWSGDLRLFRSLRGNVDRALRWIDSGMAEDGYLRYQRESKKGLSNQGWKDSGDAIVNADGTLARPPIALVEVQGYVYAAKRAIAEMFARDGDVTRAAQLRAQAQGLRRRFNRDFWVGKNGIYAMALGGGNRKAAVVSSNPGHALWTGIADHAKARRTAERLLRDDMFSGWGVRTLSARERRYNPIGYHVGTVWPHDNAILAAGLRRYGFLEAARQLFTAMLEAASFFPDFRLPEAFSGLSRAEYGVPVRYPVACHPQAWAAGTLPYMLQTALGLQANAFERKLVVMQPVLPQNVRWAEVRNLRIGRGRVDLRFKQQDGGGVTVEVLHCPPEIQVLVKESAPSKAEKRVA